MFRSFNVHWASIGRVLLFFAVLQFAACGSAEDRAQSYYDRGVKLLSQQDYVKASIEFKNALQLKTDLVGAWRGLAQIEERNKDTRSLIPILRNIVELDPKDLEANLRLARLLLSVNALDEALKSANAANDLNGRDARVLGLKAGILFRLGDTTGASREAGAALEIDPANLDATIVLAAIRLSRGDPQGALQILNRESTAHTNDIGIQLFKVKILEQLGDTKQAEAVIRNLVELYPQAAGFRGLLIKYLLDHQHPDEAEKELRLWVASNPKDVVAELNLVRFLHAVKGAAAARHELVARIDAGEKVSSYELALADIYRAEGNLTESVGTLERLAATASSSAAAITAQIKLAELQFNNKKYEAAESLVSEILRKDDRNVDGLRLRAALRMEQGQLDTAISDARRALNDHPRSTELALLLAAAYERSGSIELAEKQYADATKASGLEPSAGLTYAAFQRRRGEIARAEDTLTQLAERWPNNVDILTELANIRLVRQNWVGAQEIADRIRRVGNRALADQILGVTLGAREKYDESIKIFETANAAAPGAVKPMVGLVNELVRAGKSDQAATFLQTVLQSNPANAEAHVLMGSLQLQKNAPELASKSFQTAIERQPKNIAGYQALAELRLSEKNVDEALKVIRTGLQQLPDSFEMRLTLASALVLKKDYESAIAEFESLLKQNPGSLVVANNLASLLSDYRTDKASLERAYSVAAILRKSPVSSFKDTLGWVSFQRGDYTTAVPLLEQAAVELPGNPVVRYHLGMSYIATGQLAKAGEELKKARELAPNNEELQVKIKAAQEKVAM